MNYSILKDEKALRDFIAWLPDLEPNETFFVALFARKKYAPESELKADKAQLKAFTSDKEYLFDKIRQLECPVGSYTSRGGGVPQEALALYINPNPRNLEKAAKNLIKVLVDCVTTPYQGYNPRALALTEIQQSKSRGVFFDFDIDMPKGYTGDRSDFIKEVRVFLEGKINPSATNLLLTRGGVHLLVEVARIEDTYKRGWYNALSAFPGVDVKGDNLIPVPGCVQGGHLPELIRAGV